MSKQGEIDTFLLKALYRNCGIPVCVYQKDAGRDTCVFRLPGEKKQRNVLNTETEILREIERLAEKSEKPILYMEEDAIYFGAYKDRSGFCHIWGPVAQRSMSKPEQAAYRNKHRIADKEYEVFESSLEMLCNIMSIASYSFCENAAGEDEIVLGGTEEIGDMADSPEMERYIREKSESQLYLLDRSEMNVLYSNSDYERRYQQAIEEGDVEGIKKLIHIDKLDIEGNSLTAKNSMKQNEYLCVMNSVLVSRAAVRGGLNPRLAWSLSDMYIEKLSRCKSIKEISLLNSRMTLDFAERVNKAKAYARRNVYVEKAKDYIALNLRRRFSVAEMAEKLEVDRSYLSRLFTKQEGITVQQYILKERLSHAANMLKFTDYSIAVIAEYFCFSAQSHFTRQFKKEYGMSPYEYRKKNRYVEGFKRN